MDVVKDVAPAAAKVLDEELAHKTLRLIIKGTESGQPRLVQRALRQNAGVRRLATASHLEKLMNQYLPVENASFKTMAGYISKIKDFEATLPPPPPTATEEAAAATTTKADAGDAAADAMDTTDGEDAAAEEEKAPEGPPAKALPEVEIYLFTLVLSALLRHNLMEASPLAAAQLVQRCMAFNRRSLDLLASRAYFMLALTFERVNRLSEIRSTLLRLYRTACVRHDDVGQAMLLNLLLRNFLHYNLIEQARLLSSRTTFPENASNNQFCRFLYYMGRIQAVQLEYADAYKRLMWASRKSPQDTGVGFARVVLKLTIIVQLLMGEIPERAVFNVSEHRAALVPYLELAKAVRAGDPTAFSACLNAHGAVYTADDNLSLVKRLGHNVVKIGLRKISVSYSRISLADVASKLSLPSVQGAEYICAKAIRDNVIDATIDHANGALISNDAIDVYATDEPQKAFHARIGFCLDVHNDAVKAMRYPGDAHRMPKKSSGTADDEEQDEKTIEEIIKEMEEDED